MIRYSVTPKRNPRDKEAAPKYYATAQKASNIDLDNIAQRIAFATTATRADVMAVITATIDYLMDDLKAGHSVNLGELGTFRIMINSKGAVTADDFTSDLIKSAHVRYFPSKKIKNIYSELAFKKVPPRKTVADMLGGNTGSDNEGGGEDLTA